MNRNDKLIDEAYLAYVRTLPCLVCGRHPVDPDHLKARGWREAKRNDFSAIPLCREHHGEREQIGNVKFCEKHSLGNLWELVFYTICGYLKEKQDECA